MSSAPEEVSSSAPASEPAPAWNARGVLRWVSCNNPFYVLSAGLFLVGVYVSFGLQENAAETWALMGSLSGYTLLLAAAALLLVRFAKVWDDVRTVLLLIVLMFLATSVTFDFALVNNPERGVPVYVIGWLLSIAISEGLLRGIRLKLPAGYRLPYYLILSLFFIYPLALRPWAKFPPRERLEWGLLSFTTVMGLAFLTLIPAIRRGQKYVENNGSPWIWPLYPWSLFFVLALAVPARSFLLCWSMHPVSVVNMQLLIFAPYFLVPFGFAIAALLLEGGLVSRRQNVVTLALMIPLFLVLLSLVGHRTDPIYRNFFNAFLRRMDGDPLHITLLISAAFYAYGALRRGGATIEMLTASLIALGLFRPNVLDTHEFSPLRVQWLIAAALLQVSMGIWNRSSARTFAGCSLLAVWLMLRPTGAAVPDIGHIVGVHLFLFAMLLTGEFADDVFAHVLRGVGLVSILLVAFLAIFGVMQTPIGLPSWTISIYPLVLAALLAGYGMAFRRSSAFYVAACIPLGWLIALGWRGYLLLRQMVSGLDYIVVSLVLFAVAIAVSLSKAGVLPEAVRLTVGKITRAKRG